MRNSLLEYCKLDTLAMVKILEKLKGIWWLIHLVPEKNLA
jgi:hypothetical protein